MTQIAFLLLCHKDPEDVIAQVRSLVAGGDKVAIHHDANASADDHRRLREALDDLPGVVFVRQRQRCGWGDWSLVAATLAAARLALVAFPDATHFYLISGDCRPIKSGDHVRAALASGTADHIESVDFFASGWIKTGLREERLIYRHLFNERRHKWLFYALLAVQRRLGLRRALPKGLHMRVGSQWWCLRRATLEAVLRLVAARPALVRFFRHTWIPDETFFQTLVHQLVPEAEIRCQSPTLHLFTDYGMPVVFHLDQEEMLLAEDRFFARKISPGATGLRARLDALWASGRRDFAQSGAAARQFAYLAGRGRAGLRFAPRAWERESRMGFGRSLLLVSCKKWHVGRRVAARIGETAGIPAFGYIFHEVAAPLPDLGGIEGTLAKRTRHRKSLVRLLFDRQGAERIVICIDPHAAFMVEDFRDDEAETRLLEVDCALGEAFLAGHAARVGLLSPGTPPALRAEVTAALGEDLKAEVTRLRALRLPAHHLLREGGEAAEMCVPLAAFAGIPVATAAGILAAPDLFAD